MKVTQDITPKTKLAKSQELLELSNNTDKKILSKDSSTEEESSYSVKMSKDALSRKDYSDIILNELKKIPEVRQDKVDSIKAKIANGTYKINSESILNNFLKEEALDSMAYSLLTRKET